MMNLRSLHITHKRHTVGQFSGRCGYKAKRLSKLLVFALPRAPLIPSNPLPPRHRSSQPLSPVMRGGSTCCTADLFNSTTVVQTAHVQLISFLSCAGGPPGAWTTSFTESVPFSFKSAYNALLERHRWCTVWPVRPAVKHNKKKKKQTKKLLTSSTKDSPP